MICKRLYRYILQNGAEMEKGMYEYGIQCAVDKEIDFAAVAKTFDELKFTTEDRDSNIKIIVKGFCRGLAKAEH